MWNFCFVCGCPSVRALQGIRIQGLIQHTVIRICIMDLLHSSKSDHGTETTFSPTHWGLYKVSVVSFFAILNIFCKISLSGDKSSLVQTMAWCHQATNHYLIQYWPNSTSPYDVTRPRWARQKRGLSWQRVNNCKWLSNSYIQNRRLGTNKYWYKSINKHTTNENISRAMDWLFFEVKNVVILFNINANLCKQRGRLGVAQGHRYPYAYKDSFSILNFILIVWGRNRHTMKWTPWIGNQYEK